MHPDDQLELTLVLVLSVVITMLPCLAWIMMSLKKTKTLKGVQNFYNRPRHNDKSDRRGGSANRPQVGTGQGSEDEGVKARCAKG